VIINDLILRYFLSNDIAAGRKGQYIMDENKKKALGAALMQIEKQFGKGSSCAWAMWRLLVTSMWFYGFFRLGYCAGLRRFASRSCYEIYGPESSGKTTLTLQVIAEMQKLGGTAAFVDAEHALDPGMPKKSVLMSMTCWCPSRIPANKRWKLPTCWCAPVRLMWSWSIRLRL